MSPMLYYTLPALGGYILLSIFFLRRPRLLHPACAPAFCVRLAAHRGGELGTGGTGLASPGVGKEDDHKSGRPVPRWTSGRGGPWDARSGARTKVERKPGVGRGTKYTGKGWLQPGCLSQPGKRLAREVGGWLAIRPPGARDSPQLSHTGSGERLESTLEAMEK